MLLPGEALHLAVPVDHHVSSANVRALGASAALVVLVGVQQGPFLDAK